MNFRKAQSSPNSDFTASRVFAFTTFYNLNYQEPTWKPFHWTTCWLYWMRNIWFHFENVYSLDLKFSSWIWSLHFANIALIYEMATSLYNVNFYWLHPNSLIWFTQKFPLQLISWLLETPFQKFVTFLLLSKLYLPTSMFLLMCLQ